LPILAVLQEPYHGRDHEPAGEDDAAHRDLRLDPTAPSHLPCQQDQLSELYSTQSQPQQMFHQGKLSKRVRTSAIRSALGTLFDTISASTNVSSR
jgi:hypothetical protein